MVSRSDREVPWLSSSRLVKAPGHVCDAPGFGPVSDGPSDPLFRSLERLMQPTANRVELGRPQSSNSRKNRSLTSSGAFTHSLPSGKP